MDKKFSEVEIQALAELERDMDSGIQPFVVLNGHRWAFMPEVLAACGCVSGQTVNDTIIRALLENSLAHLRTQIALGKARGES